MTQHTAGITTPRWHARHLLRAVARQLSGQAHAAADNRARARGWEVTETPSPLGLTGRRYHDPRFTTRNQGHQSPPGREDRDD